jgi:hypothetical protein
MVISGVIAIAIGTAGEWSRLAFSTRSASALIYLTLIGSIVAYRRPSTHSSICPFRRSLSMRVNPLIAVWLGAVVGRAV